MGSLRVLLADDNDTDRMILEAIVRKQGHEVKVARDGVEAVEYFDSFRPDLVLLDVMMPNMDGRAAARAIKQAAGDDLVPIIFLTSIREAGELAGCLEAGGDDFLNKPYNPVVLKAKIQAFSRMRRLHQSVQEQREHLVQEQVVAKAVFDSIANRGALQSPNVRFHMSPMAIFNGDVLLVARSPSSNMYIFLGDFTGHGLPAAIGTMPLADIFYGMVQKGFALQDLVREINAKLHRILPVGLFCCANVIELDFRNRRLEIWAGGLPECLVFNPRLGQRMIISSRHLPMGVNKPERFRYNSYLLDMEPDDRIYLWSDGLLEARDNLEQMFGLERVFDIFARGDTTPFQTILAEVQEFSAHRQDDDITLIEVAMLPPDGAPEEASDRDGASLMGPMDWSMDYELRGNSIGIFDPIPLLNHVLMQVPGLRSYSGRVHTILAELYANSLDHGILGLSSELKQTAHGFAEFYRLRQERMAGLTDGKIRFHLSHTPTPEGGLLTLRVSDSGPGFDWEAVQTRALGLSGYAGRGVPLVRSLCRHVDYRGVGNEVIVEFVWQYAASGHGS